MSRERTIEEQPGRENRRKRRRFSHVRFYFINILLGVVIVAIVCIMAIYVFCTVHTVTVEGNTIYTDEQVEEYVLSDKYSNNAVYEALINTIKPKKDIPFIDKVSVRLIGYDSLRITVTEKKCVGYIPLTEGGYAYFDEDGCIVECSERVLPDVVQVTGVLLEDAQVGQQAGLEEKQLSFMVSLLKKLKKYNLPVNALAFDEQGNVTVVYGTIYISVGDSDYLEEKIMRLPHILPYLEGQTGILHLEDWTEDNTDIVFERPKE